MEVGSCCSSLVGSDFLCLCTRGTERQSAGAGLQRHGYSQIKRSFICLRLRFQTHAKSTKISNAATTIMASSLYSNRNRDRDSARTQMYTRLNTCLVLPPSPNYVRPRAIIKFLGGAFIGAVPEVTYSYLIEQLAKDGFLIILVPYNVTFDHSEAANQVYQRFNTCYNAILNSGLTQANLTSDQLANLPLFSVGHSNGALLQSLTGSYFSEKIPKANVIISYNNRPATEAVPYFEQLGPVVNQVMPVMEASPIYSIARSASGDAWKVFLDVAGSLVPDNEKESLTALNKFADQLPSVLNQVAQGVSEFRPPPSENRDLFKRSYNVQHTLLVKFKFDTIDETDILEETLIRRVQSFGGTVEKVELSGNHITPCIQEPKWQVSDLYTPVDAVAQGLKSLSLSETRNLSRTKSNWFRRFEN